MGAGLGRARARPPPTLARRMHFGMEEAQREAGFLKAAVQRGPRGALGQRLRLPVVIWLPRWAPGPEFASGG